MINYAKYKQININNINKFLIVNFVIIVCFV